ncbi:MAG: hypothetical protein R3Y43_03570 [Alphaproteobacteria bacterium]
MTKNNKNYTIKKIKTFDELNQETSLLDNIRLGARETQATPKRYITTAIEKKRICKKTIHKNY